ncbi:hypothetical protein SAMN05216267_1002280 [Actinacidiphila rubida]|uniref:Uncharacterized protein n=1 Tax=Actinacidiphila rubida TaxID=310780 RepID=A0A1H8EMP0_9ACTN|nr:hypothetical protein [Actinacidiphila rubida]SEN20656.1 hypothetical protein SAMN05216267_1002280 [Actinacidiphila rubida]
MDESVGERVGMFCEQLSLWPELATTIRDGGSGAALAELLTLLAGRAAPSDGPRMSVLMDAIEEACAAQGVPPGRTRRFPLLPLGMGGAGHPPPPPELGRNGEAAEPAELVGWTCPLDRCSRVVLPEESASHPTCAAAHGEDRRMRPYVPRPR